VNAAAPLRVAVVGTGAMGRHHARVYRQLKGVHLVGVLDPDRQRGEQVASQNDCAYISEAGDLLSRVDAVSIAVPTSLHADIAVPFLRAGIHCLIEKPIAATAEEVERIDAAAQSGGALVQVGHIERYNPAFRELRKLIYGQRVHAVEVRRMSPDSRRVCDVDVILDLMIHDIDLALDLCGDGVTGIQAAGVRGNGSAGIDYGAVLITFVSGTLCTLIASRITEEKIRSLSLTAEGMYVDLDFITRQVLVYRRSQIVDSGASQYRLEATIEKLFVPQEEPLVAELRDFVRVIEEKGKPLVGIAEAQRALLVAQRIRSTVLEQIHVTA
jgi:virulence factor